MKTLLTTFYIVRHGETDWNVQGRLQGHADIPLNSKGHLQAKLVASELKHITFDHAFSSDLLRAKRTTEIIAKEHNLEVQTTKLLRERYFGTLEGSETSALRAFDDYYLTLSDEQKKKHKYVDDMESDEELISRFITFIRETAITHPSKTILVGTHGGLMRLFLIHLGTLTYNHSHSSVGNGSFIHLQSDGVEFNVKELHNITTDQLMNTS